MMEASVSAFSNQHRFALDEVDEMRGVAMGRGGEKYAPIDYPF
jgi:hypothetical protein